ncbi:Hypothetical protein NTJ_09270 [Nesidiocoris tenuis]|uniref:Nucleolar protein 14 n=1 Tax=Nesidiocoris tenuis TaxID=355587 RepID=A0ABN7AWX0_9HEMI|nr:Hypothetical protein NTJ_09270 [Nesidiocoris tenuis]
MGKTKKKGLSDLKNDSSRKKSKAINPFEIRVNRQKFNVLGRTLKTDRGRPGLSRAKSINKRKETLLQEYKVQGKSNKFLDRRIGEFNKNMTAEDKIMARFTAERAKTHRKALFNLADDEPLTHKGRSIMELETFEDPPSDGDDDPYNRKLDGKFVEEAHFGGGMLKKAEGSRMAVIDQLIADSKMRKAEKAANKEQTLAATEQLDQEWKDLLPVLGAGKPSDSEDTKKDDYDKILGSLRFEPRGTPSDRLQSESEVAEKEAKRLRELEEERLRRMTGEAGPESNKASNKSQNHRSADDLDDGFALSDDEEEEEFILTYDKDGKAINMPDDSHSKRDIEDEDGEENEDDDDDSEENSDEETDDDFSDLKLTCDDDENDDNDDVGGPDLISSSTVGSKRKAAGSADDSDNDETTTSTKKKTLSPTQEQQVLADGPSGEEKAENQIQDRPDGSKKAKKVSFSSDVNLVNYESEGPAVKSLEELETIKKDKEHLLMEAARTELPYTFLVPGEYEEFEELLKDRSLAQQAVILERMIKCTHPSLKEGNKGKLETLFTFVLQKLNDDDYSTVWSSLETFAPYLFDLTQFSPKHAAEAVNDVLAEKFSDYLKKKTHYPYPDTFVFLKLVPILFPPSDKRHQVTTPALLFILSMLNTCRPNNRRGIACGLFLCSLLTQYVSLSKRIAPEAITFLVGIFRMASHKLGAKESQIAGPFLPEYKFLNFSEDLSNMNSSCKMSFADLGQKGIQIDNAFRVAAMYSALTVLETFCSFYNEKPAVHLLLAPAYEILFTFKATLKKTFINADEAIINVDSNTGLKTMLIKPVTTSKVVIERYPQPVVDKFHSVIDVLKEYANKKLPPLVKEASKPKSLRLYKPNIKPVFDKNKIKDERIRMKRRVKKETKGALREIRKDRTFIDGVRFREQKASDMERMRKVKEIYGWGAQQQGELNKLDRIKKRKKNRR